MASSKSIAISTLVIRISALLVLAASIVVMGTNSITDDDDGTKTRFNAIVTYRYVLAFGIVGFLYTLVQIPFAVYHVCTEKRWIRNACLPAFDFYGDKVMSFLLANAVGAGFAVTNELKKFFNDLLCDQSRKFFNQAYISVGLLFLGFVCMAILDLHTFIRCPNLYKQ